MEILDVDLVHAGKFIHVGEEDVDLDDAGQTGACGLEDCTDVLNDPMLLRRRVRRRGQLSSVASRSSGGSFKKPLKARRDGTKARVGDLVPCELGCHHR